MLRYRVSACAAAAADREQHTASMRKTQRVQGQEALHVIRTQERPASLSHAVAVLELMAQSSAKEAYSLRAELTLQSLACHGTHAWACREQESMQQQKAD